MDQTSLSGGPNQMANPEALDIVWFIHKDLIDLSIFQIKANAHTDGHLCIYT